MPNNECCSKQRCRFTHDTKVTLTYAMISSLVVPRVILTRSYLFYLLTHAPTAQVVHGPPKRFLFALSAVTTFTSPHVFHHPLLVVSFSTILLPGELSLLLVSLIFGYTFFLLDKKKLFQRQKHLS